MTKVDTLVGLNPLDQQNLSTIEKISEFRKSKNLKISIHSPDFHHWRHSHPYFGYIPVQISGITSFLMFSNNDDFVPQSYFWFGPDSYESLSMSIWIELAKKSQTILDIGSFTGIYSLAARKANPDAEIHAFEPLKPTFERLLINLRVNRYFASINAHNIALSNKEGPIEFHYYRDRGILQAGASYVTKGEQQSYCREMVEMRPCDTILSEHDLSPNLIKIDVEEAELDLLESLYPILEKHHPQIICEVSPKTSAEACRIFRYAGYKLKIIDDVKRTMTNVLKPFDTSNVVNLLATY